MSATPEQIKELAQAMADQAQAVADGKIPEHLIYAQAAKLSDNADTLKSWARKPHGRVHKPVKVVTW